MSTMLIYSAVKQGILGYVTGARISDSTLILYRPTLNFVRQFPGTVFQFLKSYLAKHLLSQLLL